MALEVLLLQQNW